MGWIWSTATALSAKLQEFFWQEAKWTAATPESTLGTVNDTETEASYHKAKAGKPNNISEPCTNATWSINSKKLIDIEEKM